jgi:hypothetical protein
LHELAVVEGLGLERLNLGIDQRGHRHFLGVVNKNYRMRKLIGRNHKTTKGFYS